MTPRVSTATMKSGRSVAICSPLPLKVTRRPTSPARDAHEQHHEAGDLGRKHRTKTPQRSGQHQLEHPGGHRHAKDQSESSMPRSDQRRNQIHHCRNWLTEKTRTERADGYGLQDRADGESHQRETDHGSRHLRRRVGRLGDQHRIDEIDGHQAHVLKTAQQGDRSRRDIIHAVDDVWRLSHRRSMSRPKCGISGLRRLAR